jgi:hypothetical protein
VSYRALPKWIAHLAGFPDETSPPILPSMDPSLTRRVDAPDRSVGQRREALALANEVRFKRAALKVALKRGELSIIPLIEEPPLYLASARVAELLMALPAHGPVRVERLLESCQVSPRKTIAGLNDRQRRDLISALKT